MKKGSPLPASPRGGEKPSGWLLSPSGELEGGFTMTRT